MDDLYDLPDADICQPPWLSDFIQEEFPELLTNEDDENDFLDYIYPMETDGVIQYLYGSHLREILKLQTSTEVDLVEDFLRSIDLLQKDYLPAKHLLGLQNLVSDFSFQSLFYSNLNYDS